MHIIWVLPFCDLSFTFFSSSIETMTNRYKLFLFKVYGAMIWYIYTLWNDYYIKKINIPVAPQLTLCVCVCVCMVRRLSISSLSKFQVNNTLLLTVVTILNLLILKLKVPFGQHLPIFPNPQAPVTILLLHFYGFNSFLDSIYKWDHAVFLFLCLAYFT